MDYAVEVLNLSKTFYVRKAASATIREHAMGMFSKTNRKQEIQALNDINFSVKEGEFFGIIGRNGSGKSTLLNVIMGAIPGNKGSVIKTKGKVIRLALGMGFDPNLTARDNIYVNSSILGLSFKRVGQIFDDIIGFAELENFVDVPIKGFSKGMQAKLKFSIAVHAQADIFLMDEFGTGVGDITFKEKSEQVFKSTFMDGRTIIYVNHSMESISNYCNRVMILDRGTQMGIGEPDEMVQQYKDSYKN